jgi:hypothetical protein
MDISKQARVKKSSKTKGKIIAAKSQILATQATLAKQHLQKVNTHKLLPCWNPC